MLDIQRLQGLAQRFGVMERVAPREALVEQLLRFCAVGRDRQVRAAELLQLSQLERVWDPIPSRVQLLRQLGVKASWLMMG